MKGRDLADLLDDCGVPRALQHSLTVLRGDLEKLFCDAGLDMKGGGIDLLDGENAASCGVLLRQLAEYGVLMVPGGELESWLKVFGITAKKNEWLAQIFERMGSDSNSSFYIRPGTGDVWDFMRRVASWVNNPARLGMPLD